MKDKVILKKQISNYLIYEKYGEYNETSERIEIDKRLYSFKELELIESLLKTFDESNILIAKEIIKSKFNEK